MKCLSKGCKNTSFLMTVELCHPCTQLIEHKREWAEQAEKQQPITHLMQEVTRLEIIDENGRSYTKYQIANIEFSLQDDNRTLKIFLKVNKDKASFRKE
jgi:hypothetical protein